MRAAAPSTINCKPTASGNPAAAAAQERTDWANLSPSAGGTRANPSVNPGAMRLEQLSTKGHLLLQSITLGLVQIGISFSVNLAIVCAAGSIAGWFATRPTWLNVQRWVMASVLAALAVRLLLDRRQM